MQIKIDKNIPIPASKRGLDKDFPFKQMNVGDSFYYKAKKLDKAIIAATYNRARAAGVKITVRTNESKTGMRVWRTA